MGKTVKATNIANESADMPFGASESVQFYGPLAFGRSVRFDANA